MTGGRNYGVMKRVGDAVRDYTIANGNKKPLIALGIVTWGCINNREVLVSKKVCVAAADIGRLLWCAVTLMLSFYELLYVYLLGFMTGPFLLSISVFLFLVFFISLFVVVPCGRLS